MARLRFYSFDGKTLYEPPFGLCGLSEDETAIAQVMESTAKYSKGEIEKPIYTLEEAIMDSQMMLSFYKKMAYNFYGWQSADVSPANEKYKSIKNPRELYDLLLKIWCAETCAPRMRENWKNSHPTYGQCSITAFLAQDIFGGEVYGILREGGNYHCYNVIGDCVFDLTSEQFGDEKLNYENNPVQSREVHFAKEEKKLRYEYLKAKLNELIRGEK